MDRDQRICFPSGHNAHAMAPVARADGGEPLRDRGGHFDWTAHLLGQGAALVVSLDSSLRMQWMPAVGVLALVSPLIALAALFLRCWRFAALTLIALCAALQFGYVGLETYWKAQERAGAFEQDYCKEFGPSILCQK